MILLNWSDPWTWVRRVREWVRFLRSVLISLDDETKAVMEETMVEWRDRKRGLDSISPGSGGGSATIPLGPGEWDEGLGFPLCVVCQGVCLYIHILSICGQESIARNILTNEHYGYRRTKWRNWKEIMAGVKVTLILYSSLCEQFSLNVRNSQGVFSMSCFLIDRLQMAHHSSTPLPIFPTHYKD